MATPTKTEEDADLAELLDSALADFSDPKTDHTNTANSHQKEEEQQQQQEQQEQQQPKLELSTTGNGFSSSLGATGGNSTDDATHSDPNEAAEKLASELLGGLEGLYKTVQTDPACVNPNETEEFISRLESQISNLDSTMRSLLEPSAGDDGDPGVTQMKEELRRLVDNVDSTDVNSPKDLEDISQTMQDTLRKLNADLPDPSGISEGATSSEPNDPFAPFMEQMLSALLSREVLYLPLKGIIEKYPSWIEENTTTLSSEKLSTYRRQLELMQEVCREFEKSAPKDPDTMKIFSLVQRMQELGPPPEELVGSGVDDGALPPALSGDTGGCPTM